ncbi:hypothetical protein F4825DRAFT_467683 [Nemania diffusa]|nr:hypothetical protein F4825DRAFT_467683 [Nemania diffusa]
MKIKILGYPRGKSKIGYTRPSITDKSPSTIILSGIFFALIIILLKIYNKKPVPQFTYGITLNAMISTLATISKSFLLAAVAGSISQLKWRWYQNSEGRPVFDTQLFHDASRGPLGSIIILTKACNWPLVSIGAFVSILALAFDPFTQQVITYPTQTRITYNPTTQPSNISRAKTYVTGDSNPFLSATLAVEKIVAGALWDSSSDHNGLPVAHCPTGNCTWGEFESLALCSSCQNRTDLEISGCSLSWNASEVQQAINSSSSEYYFSVTRNCSLEFPTDLFCDLPTEFSIEAHVWKNDSNFYWWPFILDYPSHLFAASSATEISTDDGSQSLGDWNPLKFCHIQTYREKTGDIEAISIKQATACQLTPCAKNYSFSVSNGTPRLKTLGERYGSWYFNITGLLFSNGGLYDAETGLPFERDLKSSWSDVVGENGRLVNLTTAHSPYKFSSTPFTISADDWPPLGNLNNLLTGQIRIYNQFADDERNSISTLSGFQFKEQFFVSQDVQPSSSDPQSLLNLHQIANKGGLTWAIPQIAGRLSKFIREKDGIPVPGKSYGVVKVVKVRWYWLSLPAVTWIIGTGFFITTMWVCSRDGQMLWKLSSLPLIYHGFDAGDLEAINTTSNEIDKVSGMEGLAKNLRARLRRNSVTGQLKLTEM